MVLVKKQQGGRQAPREPVHASLPVSLEEAATLALTDRAEKDGRPIVVQKTKEEMAESIKKIEYFIALHDYYYNNVNTSDERAFRLYIDETKDINIEYIKLFTEMLDSETCALTNLESISVPDINEHIKYVKNIIKDCVTLHDSTTGVLDNDNYKTLFMNFLVIANGLKLILHKLQNIPDETQQVGGKVLKKPKLPRVKKTPSKK